MKKILPKLIIFLLTVFALGFSTSSAVFSQTFQPLADPIVPTVTPVVPTTTPGAQRLIIDACPTCEEGEFYRNEEVTFVGRNAARSGFFLDWTLQRYEWARLPDGTVNPLLSFWATIRNIVLALFVLFIMVTAFILIITRGKSITAKKFILRYLGVILLVLFSFAIIEFLYQIVDIIQGFFIRIRPGDPLATQTIGNKDLLFVGWRYEDFIGFRRWGDQFNESAFISLLLVKLTSLTYYVMVGILIIRKIILWFFIIISPVFPILLLYYPIRNTAKIWVGEFFRWLLYGPLFALFLAGLVSMWQNQSNGIPLGFKPDDVGIQDKAIYTTSINILLGGPGQVAGEFNSVNIIDTFALYVIALIMLWTVIIFPWILLQIFLDYAMNYNYGSSAIFKQVSNLLGKGPSPPPPPPVPGAGGRSMPFAKKFAMPMPAGVGKAMEIPVVVNRQYQTPVTKPLQLHSEIMKLTNLSVPTMRDIAKYETASLSNDVTKREEIKTVQQTLARIANPTMTTTSNVDRQRYQLLKERLVTESNKGNAFASSILNAATNVSNLTVATSSSTQIINNVRTVLQQVANPTNVPPLEREKIQEVHNIIIHEKEKGNQLATIILTTKDVSSIDDVQKLKDQVKREKEKGNPVAEKVAPLIEKAERTAAPALKPASFPTVNRVQAVSLDDYETVKKMWVENYQNLEVPQKLDGSQTTRQEWVHDDIAKITQTVHLLASTDQKKVKEGMEAVSNILPFLLIGGFSQSEITAYLKAKLEAAKSVLEDQTKKEEEEATSVTSAVHRQKSDQVMHMAEEASLPEAQPDLSAETKTSEKKETTGDNGQNSKNTT